jgi:hypothetical protein
MCKFTFSGAFALAHSCEGMGALSEPMADGRILLARDRQARTGEFITIHCLHRE